MKRLGLLSIIGCSVSGVAIAAGVDCSVIPTCAEMGFTKSITDCDGKVMLRCPFDVANDSAVYCGDGELCSDEYNLDACPENGSCEECGGKQKFNGCNSGYSLADGNVCCSDEYYNLDNKPANSETEQCGNKYHFVGCKEGYTEENGSCVFKTGVGCTSLGSILYNDLNCYDTAPSGKTAIGVVFDVTNKLAVVLTEIQKYWSSYSYQDISGLTNYTSSSKALADTTGGKANTAAIMAGSSTTNASSSYAPGYCYNLTAGGLPTGSWFLPSIKELNTIYNNKSTIDSAITSAGGTTISGEYHWSSTEYSSSNAWGILMGSGSVGSPTKDDSSGYVRCAVAF